MAFVLAGSVPWHEGEEKMHKLMRVPPEDNPTVPYLSPGAATLLQRSPLLALGALDEKGRPWATVWGGQPGFAGPIAQSIIGIRHVVDNRYDPVVEALYGSNGIGKIVKEEDGKGRLVSALSIDLENRKRVKLMGRMVAGALDRVESENGEDIKSSSEGDDVDQKAQAQLVIKIEGSLGNCPKYINRKEITSAIPEPKLVSDSPQLPQGAIDLLSRIDTLFLSTSNQNSSMDSNIRGGPRGFVRVLSNDTTGAVLVYPEYSGNRLYQSLGNLQTTPLAGYVFPDFESGNVLYITSKVDVLVGKEASDLLPKSNLAVKLTITAATYVEKGLSFRGEAGEPSPYNPTIRYLVTEKETPGAQSSTKTPVSATLIKKEIITPTIYRFRFKISDPSSAGNWLPGQYATLSFDDELNMGYSHMKDDDPTSINDDYIRTFTISSHPGRNLAKDQFEITVRKNGNVTSHLFRTNERSAMEVPLCGFGGDFKLEQSAREDIIPFVAGGIGVTPLIAQISNLDIAHVKLLWSISIKDIGLIYDVFEQFPELPKSTLLFITGSAESESGLIEDQQMKLKSVSDSNARVERRRLVREDLDNMSDAPTWYICASPVLKATLLNWLTGKTVVHEDFNY